MRVTKKIGIFYLDEQWADIVIEEVMKDIPCQLIKLIGDSNVNGRWFEFKDGGWVKTIKATNNNVRGKKVEMAIMQEGIDKETQDSIYAAVVHSDDVIVLKYKYELENL